MRATVRVAVRVIVPTQPRLPTVAKRSNGLKAACPQRAPVHLLVSYSARVFACVRARAYAHVCVHVNHKTVKCTCQYRSLQKCIGAGGLSAIKARNF